MATTGLTLPLATSASAAPTSSASPAPASAGPSSAGPSSVPARAELRGWVENVGQASARRYAATDNTGRGMDTAKIIQDSAGEYLAVYHTMLDDGRFHSAIAVSRNLITWTRVHDFGAGSSQPTIARISDGGYVMAWEQDPSNHIAVRYFPNRAALFRGTATRSFDTVRTLSDCAEGTPNIYSVHLNPDIDHSTIDIGGHYFADCVADRQMRATLTDFSHWTAKPQPDVDNAVLPYGVKGNIGDRDSLVFRGHQYGLIEGQYVNGDFGSWRTFLYDYRTGKADAAHIRTDGGSTAFANPSITALRAPNGRKAVLISLYLPSEGAAPGESGQLIYYRTY